jgi:hypothetical protein
MRPVAVTQSAGRQSDERYGAAQRQKSYGCDAERSLPIVGVSSRSSLAYMRVRRVKKFFAINILSSTGPLLVDLVINDDLVLRFLQLYQLAELGRLLALPLRITSADGSNTLTILPPLRLSPSKMCAMV